MRRKLEIGHGKLLEPVDISRQDMDQIEDILSLFGTVKQEDIKGMTLVCNGRIERRTELLSILSFRLKDAVMDEKDRRERCSDLYYTCRRAVGDCVGES